MSGCNVLKYLLLVALLQPHPVTATQSIEVGILDERAPYSDFNLWMKAEGALPELLTSSQLTLAVSLESSASPVSN